MNQFPHAVFICGTDTGVGKTRIAGAIAAYFAEKNKNIGIYKPLECGANLADTKFLRRMARLPGPLSDFNSYNFDEPLAPFVAATRSHTKISLAKIEARFRQLKKKYSPLLIEGAGGLLVPITKTKTNLDLIQKLDIPVILVARLGLGTINHTLLTIKTLKTAGVTLLGIVLNEVKTTSSLAEQTNPKILQQLGVPILGIFPHTKNSRQALLDALEQSSLKKYLI